MNQRQNNTLSMISATGKYMNDNTDAWKKNNAVSTAVANLEAAKAAVVSKTLNQSSSDSKGYTAQKNSDFENMANLAFKLSKRVNNYAVSISDAVLQEATKISLHELEHGKEKDIVNRCAMIADKAESIVADAPADYGITAGGIQTLRTAVSLIDPDTAERDVVSGNHTNATASLAALFSDARSKLLVLDGLMEGFSDDEEDDFVNGYFIVRRINDRSAGGAKKKANGGTEPPPKS